MNKQDLIAIIWKEGKYFVAQCLNVDVSSFGETKKEALKNLEEALELYFEDTPPPHAEKIERKSVSVESLAYA
jgi:predicted RNase H-like HicB family nuclease